MHKVRDVLQAATQQLGDRVDAEVLLAYALSKPRSWLIAHADDGLAAEHASAYHVLIEQRKAGEPVAYITGRRGFWSLDLEVTPATLIPRPETELLVELALERLPIDANVRVLDLGTGSGAIALAIARERPRAQVTATDASVEALAVAQRNAQRHGIGNVSFAHGNWFAPLGAQQFELIVSNPPYIESHDPHLEQGDLRFEPVSALASGIDGLDDIRRIIRDAGKHLCSAGWLLFEHGWHQGDAVRSLLRHASFAKVSTMRDLEQRDRVTGGCWSVSEDCDSP
ncbi:peptide chain release factor N(5)-glutamine methyltransferase [Dyella acidiphila]|uniref:Release factor glutamine methyltransferase n=1 Tax=Dyella acidiphila TaxID=2775866 RepID=A0ABR9G8V9_9GAMM|nr:peptide chain release factor N(5)-glutamine methyltransferase [Dyella acidiphila]MBE1160484.1 peptide chain release factor N(5)-glutamine methyltransferase [Dyella acidiphila]